MRVQGEGVCWFACFAESSMAGWWRDRQRCWSVVYGGDGDDDDDRAWCQAHEVYFPNNVANAARLGALYQHGGLYLDLDVIILRREILDLPNCLG